MKRIHTGLLIMSLAVRTASAVLVCDEPVYDFGAADETAVRNHVFTIRNEGDRPVRILAVLSGCGCAATGIAREHLEPGDITELAVRLDLRGRSGRQYYALSIRTDNPEQPFLRLGIQGTVFQEIRIEPYRLHFLWPNPGAVLPAKVKLIAGDATEFTVTGIRVSDPALVVDRETVRPGQEYLILIDLDKQNIRPPFEGIVSIETDHPRRPLLEIPVSVVSDGDVVARPTVLPIDALSENTLQQYRLIVYSRNGTPFTIENVSVPEGATCTVWSSMPHRHDLYVDVLLPAPALRRHPLTITTSLGETIEVTFQFIE